MQHGDAFLHTFGSLRAYVKSLSAEPDLSAVVRRLPSGEPLVWLDSARTHAATGRWSMLGFNPWLQLTAGESGAVVRTARGEAFLAMPPLAAFDRVWRRYAAPRTPEPFRRAVGLFGCLSYELNRSIERLPASAHASSGIPTIMGFGMRVVILADHFDGRRWIVSVVDPFEPEAERRALSRLQAAQALCDAGEPEPESTSVFFPQATAEPRFFSGLSAVTSPTQFERQVERVLDHIRAGEVYQVNLSQCFTGEWAGDPLALYLALRRINPSPFASFVRTPCFTAVGCSPERLVRVDDGQIATRPIAGTCARTGPSDDDALNSLELLLSEKERAEHIMLVDLERNDLGRVCVPGTVAVDELMTVESYSHVLHIVSNVTGRLRSGVGPADVIRAVFPGGTITGCPKVRCMEIIQELEPVARGLYTGSVGYAAFDGTMDLNIAIRTLVLQGSRLSLHVGAGIVADSIPEREYAETLAKGKALVEALHAAGRIERIESNAAARSS